jgi:nanoRNase/pAp phosphatase (c-di-AMP/oligoRNAs hydrolase)
MKSPMSNDVAPISQQRLNQLKQAVGGGPLLVLTHDNPDPDSLASGAVLSTLFETKWGVRVYMGYSGLIDRAENKAMLRLLTPKWVPLEGLGDLRKYPAIALVDTQPGAGNNSLPEDMQVQAVFDHHRLPHINCQSIPFIDIRPELGATTTLIYQYFEAAGLEPDSDLASAVFYGVQTDTQALTRSHSQTDLEIYIKALMKIDRKKLNQVIHARLSRDYYRAFNHGLESAQVFGKVIVSNLEMLHRPDFVAEIADILIRLEGIDAVLCMGYHGDRMFLSLRTLNSEDDAGQIIQTLVAPHGRAGGHDSFAGGQIILQGKSADNLAEILTRKFLTLMNERDCGEKLL